MIFVCLLKSHSMELKKNTFYTSCTLVSFIVFFLHFFFFVMWHRRTCFSAAVTRETTVLVSHHIRFLNVFIKSITNALIQLCLFISLEGFNRWKLGSSVSNKLDKQTKNHCVEPHSKMLFIHFGQEISEINLYFYMYESALSNCCIFLL